MKNIKTKNNSQGVQAKPNLLPETLRRKLPSNWDDLDQDPMVYARLFHPASGPQTDYYVLGGCEWGDDYMILVWTPGHDGVGTTGSQLLGPLENVQHRGLGYERQIHFKIRRLSDFDPKYKAEEEGDSHG